VVGVMPQDFVWWGSELWFPLAADYSRADRSYRTVAVQGRLRSGVTPQAAEAVLQSSAEEMKRRFGGQVPEYEGLRIHLVPLRDDVLRNVRQSLMILMAAVGFLLLVASANVANLQLSQVTARKKEMAIRIALGADQSRIVRQLLTESVMLAAIGAAVGCALAYASTAAIVSLIPYGFIPAESHVRLSPGVLWFAVALAIVTGVLCGLGPAVQSFRWDLNETLKQSSNKATGDRSARQTRKLLALGEVALAVVVLCGAIALVKSFRNLETVDLGFQSHGIVTMRIGLPENRYATSRVTHFFEELLRRVEDVSGIQDAALATDVPIGPILSSAITIDGKSSNTMGNIPDADYTAVSPQYFQVLSISVIRGRAITERDSDAASRVAVINQTMAGLYWPNDDAVGKRFKFGALDSVSPWITVVGIARDVKQVGVEGGSRQAFFVPFAQDAPDSRVTSLLVRSKNDQSAVVGAVRTKLAELDPELPIYQLESLDTRITNSLGGEKLAAAMLSCFASICLILTTVGLFGVISYSASQRVHEFGLRMALGASRGAIARIVLVEASKLALSGVILGCGGAVLSGRLLSTLLYGAAPADPLALVEIVGGLCVVTIAASLIPAARAMRVDPNVALCQE
jgi:putative ABC transport system permease protein